MQTKGAEALVPEPAGAPAAESTAGPAGPTGAPGSGSADVWAAPPTADSAAQPAAVRSPRIRGVDLARGLAMLGMLAAHVSMAPELVPTDPSTWAGVVHGRSSILFATLAGVSVALMTGRTTPPSGDELVRARLRLLVRAVCLFVVGGAVQLLSTPVAVILEYYAVLLVLCVPLLRVRSRWLFTAAGAVALVVPSLLVGYRSLSGVVPGLSGGGGELGQLALNGFYPVVVWAAFVLAGLGVGRLDLGAVRVRRWLVVAGTSLAVLGYGSSWVATQVFPSVDPASAYASSSSGGSAASGASGSTASSAPSSSAPYPDPAYAKGDDVDLTGFGCIDYGDGTYYCASPDSSSPITPESAADWGVGGDGSGGPGVVWPTADQLLGTAAHSGTTPEVLGSGGVALAVIGVCLVVSEALGRRRLGWLVAPVVAVGAMSLTVYSAHLVGLAVTTQLSGGYSGGSSDGWSAEPSWLVGGAWLYLLFAGAALVLCPLWLRLVGRGPLERLLTWVGRRAVRA